MGASSFLVSNREQILVLAKQAEIESIFIHAPLFEEWDEEGGIIQFAVVQPGRNEAKEKCDSLLGEFRKQMEEMCPFSLVVARKADKEAVLSGIMDLKLKQTLEAKLSAGISLEKLTEAPLSDQFNKSMSALNARKSSFDISQALSISSSKKGREKDAVLEVNWNVKRKEIRKSAADHGPSEKKRKGPLQSFNQPASGSVCRVVKAK